MTCLPVELPQSLYLVAKPIPSALPNLLHSPQLASVLKASRLLLLRFMLHQSEKQRSLCCNYDKIVTESLSLKLDRAHYWISGLTNWQKDKPQILEDQRGHRNHRRKHLSDKDKLRNQQLDRESVITIPDDCQCKNTINR